MNTSTATRLHAVYKRAVSPLIHSITASAGACRFQPTCSEYAVLAVAQHGWFRGSGYAIWRVLRCSPLSRGGFDPVPGTWPPVVDSCHEQHADSCRVGPRHLP